MAIASTDTARLTQSEFDSVLAVARVHGRVFAVRLDEPAGPRIVARTFRTLNLDDVDRIIAVVYADGGIDYAGRAMRDAARMMLAAAGRIQGGRAVLDFVSALDGRSPPTAGNRPD